MIEALLTDAKHAGAIRDWRSERRMLMPPTWTIVHNDGSIDRMSRSYVENFCVGLAIGSGMIPDPYSQEASYPC